MKKVITLAVLGVLLLAFAAPGVALAQGLREDKVVFGGTFTLQSGERLDGNLVIFGGSATLEPDSLVDGDVVLLGGAVDIGGEVNGSVVGVGGLIVLQAEAVVREDVVALGAHLEQDPSARVEGEVTTHIPGPLTFSVPGGGEAPRVDFSFSPILDFIWFFFRTFLWAALAVLLVLFLPGHVERTTQAVVSQPLVAWGLGLLTVVIAPVVVVALAITLILIPASLLLALALAIAWGFGLIAIGLEVGKRLAGLFNQTWAPAVSAGVGTFVLILVLNGVDALISCVGWIVPAAVGMVGLGGVLLTRFGAQPYPPFIPAQPAPVSEGQPEMESGQGAEREGASPPVEGGLEAEEPAAPEAVKEDDLDEDQLGDEDDKTAAGQA